jgi:acyl-coenzyme A synthetase/AMP-(fatty) acid ligase
LPLNPDWPKNRLQFIVGNARLQACLVENDKADDFAKILEESQFFFDKILYDEHHYFFKIHCRPLAYPKEMAYVLFTSGSTGFPKGIVHTRKSMNAFLNWCGKEFKNYKVKRFVSIAPLNFDLSVFDVFYPAKVKGQLFVPDHNTISNTRLFIDYISKNKIECLYTTPSYLNLLLQTARPEKYNLSFVKLILIAGEQLSYELVNRLKQHFGKATFYNLYGPTETNVCTYYKIGSSAEENAGVNVPIGKACYPKEITVKKSGELVYKGKLLMKAFLNEKGLHKAKASYETGDIVKKEGNNLVFVGRKDKMVKRNGFRIELSEIKNALLKHTAVKNCEVINKENTINAFVESSDLLSELELKTFCIDQLPSYMLPDRIICLDKLPLNSNHKVDPEALKKLL